MRPRSAPGRRQRQTVSAAGSSSSTPTGSSIRSSTVSRNRAVAALAGGIAGAEGGGLHGFAQRGIDSRDGARRQPGSGHLLRRRDHQRKRRRGLSGGAGRALAPRLARHGLARPGDDRWDGHRQRAGLAVAEGPFRLRSSRIAGNDIETTSGTGPSTARGAGLIATATAVLELKRSSVSGNRARAEGPGGSEATGGGIAVAEREAHDCGTSTVNGNVASAEGQARGGGIILLSGGPSLDHELDDRCEPRLRRDRARRRDQHGRRPERHERDAGAKRGQARRRALRRDGPDDASGDARRTEQGSRIAGLRRAGRARPASTSIANTTGVHVHRPSAPTGSTRCRG